MLKWCMSPVNNPEVILSEGSTDEESRNPADCVDQHEQPLPSISLHDMAMRAEEYGSPYWRMGGSNRNCKSETDGKETSFKRNF